MPATLGAADAPIPTLVNASTIQLEMSPHADPCSKPSNVTVPIITASSATVPAAGSSRGRPPSSGRRPTTPSRVSNGLSRENRLK